MYKFEIWDKKSSINGVAAEAVIKSNKIKEGKVYLIYKDDNLIILQAFDPEEPGFVAMSEDRAVEMAKKQIEEMEIADKQVEQEIE